MHSIYHFYIVPHSVAEKKQYENGLRLDFYRSFF